MPLRRRQSESEPDEPAPAEGAEIDDVKAYRCLRLLDLGFALGHALKLCTRNDVVHEAERLLSKGMTPEQVTYHLED